MIKSKILFFFLSLITCSFAQTGSFDNYISSLKTLNKVEQLIENHSYKKSKKILSSFNSSDIPYGLKRRFAFSNGEIQLHYRNFDLAKGYFSIAIEEGLLKEHLEYIISQYNDIEDFKLNMGKVYDSILSSKLTVENLKLKEKIIEICNDDQAIRSEYHNYNKMSESEKIDFFKRWHVVDSINLSVFDSISNSNLWISNKHLINEYRNVQIVLFHASKEVKYKYILKGYNLAEQNKIDWSDVIELQAFTIFKDNQNLHPAINFLPTLNSMDLKQNKNKFDFVCYCLAQSLTDGGTYNNKEKRLCFYFNSKDLKEINKTYAYIKKYLMNFNVKESQLSLEILKSTDSSVAEGQIGVQFF